MAATCNSEDKWQCGLESKGLYYEGYLIGFPMKKLNVSETKCHCYGIPNYVVVVLII